MVSQLLQYTEEECSHKISTLRVSRSMVEGWRGEPGIFLSESLYLHIGATACECSYLQLGPKAALTKAQFGQLPNYNYLLRNNDKMLSVFERKMRQDPSVYILVLQNICLYVLKHI